MVRHRLGKKEGAGNLTPRWLACVRGESLKTCVGCGSEPGNGPDAWRELQARPPDRSVCVCTALAALSLNKRYCVVPDVFDVPRRKPQLCPRQDQEHRGKGSR